MYDPPANADFACLKDRELAMLCFAPYALALHFDNGAQLQIEGEFSHVSNSGTERYRFPIVASDLTSLLMQKVKRVELEKNGKLTLDFANGHQMVIEGNVGPYEAYSLRHNGHELVV